MVADPPCLHMWGTKACSRAVGGPGRTLVLQMGVGRAEPSSGRAGRTPVAPLAQAR